MTEMDIPWLEQMSQMLDVYNDAQNTSCDPVRRLLVDGRPGNNGWDSFYQGIGNFGILNMIFNIEV